MRHDPAQLTHAFTEQAKAAQQRENAFRAEAAAEIERLERERVFAFRRVRLVGLLAGAAVGADTEDAALAAQKAVIAAEFGWDAEREDHAKVLAALAGPGRAVWTAVHAEHEAAPVAAELSTFEDWYRAHAGQSFYVLFDQYVPQAPLVDF